MKVTANYLNQWKQKIIYSFLHTVHGNTARALHWNNYESQKLRFKILTEVANIHQSSIIDVGCGLGDLYRYLAQICDDFSYTGYDVVASFIKTCKKNYPNAYYQILGRKQPSFNLNEYQLYGSKLPRFNWDRPCRLKKQIFCTTHVCKKLTMYSAVAFLPLATSVFFKEMIQRSFELANIAYAFNIHMTEAKEFFYLPKNDALKCCESLGASQVILRDDYLRNDYTIYVYRKPLKPALT